MKHGVGANGLPMSPGYHRRHLHLAASWFDILAVDYTDFPGILALKCGGDFFSAQWTLASDSGHAVSDAD